MQIKYPILLSHKALYGILFFIILFSISIENLPVAQAQSDTCSNGWSQATSLDGVDFQLCLPFRPDHSSVAEKNDWVQSGSWARVNPHQEFSIYAIPYGINPAADNLPMSSPGISDTYRHATLEIYKSDAILIMDGPSISIFGNVTEGDTYLLPDPNSPTTDQQRLITEWIAEAGNRVWIIRSIVYGDLKDPISRQTALNALKITLFEDQNLENPSTSLEQHSITPTLSVASSDLQAQGDLPTPGWWSGDCDVNNFPGSYPLGGIYRGVKACGPLNTTRQVNFGAGVLQLEWQCAELPKRYLYLLYGIAPRSADGINVVNVYDNARPNLKKVANGTPNSGLAPGDILSYNGPTAAGHTAIVSAVNIDSNGNGTYSTIEQNSSAGGSRTNTISNWWLNSNSGISAYLHDTNSNGQTNNCQNTGGTGIRLYDGTSCTGSERSYSSVGFTNTSDFNDVASSINVGDGWSVRVYEHNDRGGSSSCVTRDMWDLSVDYYTSGNTGRVMDNDISSIEVFSNSTCTGGFAPSIPNNLRTNSSSPTSITMTWDDVTNESGYKIYYWNGSSWAHFATVGANVTTYTETRSNCGWTNRYALTAYNNYGESAISDWEDGSTQACVTPGVPSLVSPSNGATVGRYDNVTLDWNSASAATQYYAEFWGGPAFNVNSGWTTNTDFFVGSSFWGGPYQWRVKSRNSSGVESGWSETRSLYRKYGTPSNLTSSGLGQSQVTLSWGTSADAPGNIDGYRIYRGGTAIATVGSTTLTYTDTGLGCNSNYSYTVRAYKGSLESDASNTVNVTTQTCSNPTDDLYEENDTLGTAYDLSNYEQTWLSAINGYGRQADEDWYRIYVTPGYVKVLVDARFTHSEGDIDIALYDSQGYALDSSTSISNSEYISYTVPEGGTYYYIKVYYADAGNSYNLWWDDIVPGVDVYIGGEPKGSYSLAPGDSTRQSYADVNDGPVQISNTSDAPMIAAERLIYKVNGVNTSFTELMGLPNNQLDISYWLPWYNNKDFDTQLRFANVSNGTATIYVYIGSMEMPGSPFTLEPGESTRKSFYGVNDGPVLIMSDQNIVAAERLIYKVNGVNTSFSEMMALPNSQLDTSYWLPWYNNKDFDTQLRFANVSGSTAWVHVYIGGLEMPGSPFMLLAGESTRQSFPGVNDGPVEIVSNQNIVAAERLIYKVNGVNTSYSELMALPNKQLDTTYWLPWYNNKELDTQLRFANVSNQTANVHVYIGGVEMGSGFTLAPGASTRQSFYGVNDGPVQVVSNVQIVAAERVIYKVNGVNTSFSEMMGLPAYLLDTTYWLPWYNNVDFDTQLRFGLP